MTKLVVQKSWKLPVTIVLFVLGILLSVQFRTQQDAVLSSQKTEDLVAMWKSFNQKRVDLDMEIDKLKQQQRELQFASALGEDTLNNIRQDIEKLELITGLQPVEGPGISVTFFNSYSLLYLDLIDLTNELWASGAEAISVNGERILATSPISDTTIDGEIRITVAGRPLESPIFILAIGDPNTLEKGLTFSGGIVDNLNTLGIHPLVRQEDRLILAN